MKITRIRLLNPIPVYDITVPITENFYLSSGIVVHNSKDQMDAVAGAVESAYKNPAKASEPTNLEKSRTLATITNKLQTLRKDRQVGKLNNQNLWR